jgi:hypothetical protein
MTDPNEVVRLAVLGLALIALGCTVVAAMPLRHRSVVEQLSDWWVIARGLASGRRARLRRALRRRGVRRG